MASSVMNKMELIKEIGEWYGTYKYENETHYLDNGEQVYEYTDVDKALKDWLPTLEQDTATDWSKEIKFIKENCTI